MKFIRVSLCCILIFVLTGYSLGLECYRCRMDYCSHEFCKEANTLMDNSGAGMSLHDWSTLPPCPMDLKSGNQSELIEECPKKSIGCGRSIYNLTSTFNKNIIPGGNGTIVPILGSGRESVNSVVVSYGCILPKYKQCNHGYSQQFKIPINQTGGGGSDKLVDVIIINTDTLCCNCGTDRCNGINSDLICDSSNPNPLPSNDQSLFPSSIGISINFNNIGFPIIGILFMVVFY